jgi:transposase-like protein
MAAGENVRALCRELGIHRRYLYQWRERFRVGEPAALRSRGRTLRRCGRMRHNYGDV